MLSEMLRKAVERNPGKIAIVQGRRRICYAELETLASQCASGLRRLGVEAGDCVAVALPNCPEFVAGLFACAKLRAVMAPLNPQYTSVELVRFAADAHAKIVITDGATSGLFMSANAIVTEFASLLHHGAVRMQEAPFCGPALYLYTSGSTDAWKRLCCTQENLVCEAQNFVDTVGLTCDDPILCTIPLHHSYGLGNCLLDAVYAGSTLVLFEPEDAPFAARCHRVLELIAEEAIRFYPGVPHQFQILAALPDAPPSALAGLKLCISSGDLLPRRTFEGFLERFGCPIRSLYGSTEAGSISIDMDQAETLQFGSLGPPLRNVEIRIRDGLGRDLPANESGEIWVKSPVLPPTGYDNRLELTAIVFKDGYYNTGDIGKKDGRGFLVMTGRKQTFVDVGGQKVDIGEVEEVLQSHPQVREAAALGVEVPNLGTLIKAVVVADGACDEASLLVYCRERLAAFKVPRLIEFRDALPRSAIGKVLKSELGGSGAYLTSASRDATPQMETLAEHIRDQAALCLQCDRAFISRSASFKSMGFDSLRAAEFHLRLVTLTGLPLSITVQWNYPNIDELAMALVAQLNAKPNDPPQPVSEPVRAEWPTILDQLLSEVESLSDSEIDASFRAK